MSVNEIAAKMGEVKIDEGDKLLPTKNVKGNRVVVVAQFSTQSVFKIPDGLDLEDETIVQDWGVKHNMLHIEYVNQEEHVILDPVWDARDSDFKRPEECEIYPADDFCNYFYEEEDAEEEENGGVEVKVSMEGAMGAKGGGGGEEESEIAGSLGEEDKAYLDTLKSMFDKMSHRAREEAREYVVDEQVKKKEKEKKEAIKKRNEETAKKRKEVCARKKEEKLREEAMVWSTRVCGVEQPHLKDYGGNTDAYKSDVYMFHKWNTPDYCSGEQYKGCTFTKEEYADMKKELGERKKAEKEEEAGARE